MVCRSILCGGRLSATSGHSLLTFLVKEGDDHDDGSKLCWPNNLRPISLSNTCIKIVASLLAIPLNYVATHCIHRAQRGGIQGRQLIDNILDIEAKALEYAMTRLKGCGAVFLDIRQAFPSLGRPYLWWVLKKSGVPEYFIQAVQELYTHCRHSIVLNGRVFGDCDIKSGVRQGCPLSMILFAFAMNPIIIAM
eukprot:11521719-Karenia_brevis.AAC.1